MEMAAQLAMEVRGGAADGVFPRIEALLEMEKYHNALIFLATKKRGSVPKKMDAYKTLTDFYVCEMFPELRGRAKKHYRSERPEDDCLLRDSVQEKEIVQMERILLYGLGCASEIQAQHRKAGNHSYTWCWFTGNVKKAIEYSDNGVLAVWTLADDMLGASDIAVEKLDAVRRMLVRMQRTAESKADMHVARTCESRAAKVMDRMRRAA